MRHYLSFDVGWSNLAFVYCTVDDQNQIHEIKQIDRVNLKEIPHKHITRSECALMHSADAHDLMQHFFQEYECFWPQIDVVLIERQPQGGLVHIEQILYGHWRHKAHLISPRSMHKHFQIQHLDYDQRKQKTTELAQPWLAKLPDWSQEDNRCHDMADALCLLLYYLSRQTPSVHTTCKNIDTVNFNFQSFVFVPQRSAREFMKLNT